MKIQKQKGFTAIEGLLVLIIVLMVGFIGYYVYHSQQSTDKTLNTAATEQTTIKSTASESKFVFTELGVQVSLPAELKDLGYSADSSGTSPVLALSTPQFVEALHKCNSTTVGQTDLAFATIAKVSGKYIANDNLGVANLKQFDGFWISGASPNGIVCDTTSQQDKDNFSAIFQSSNKALRDAFKTATLTQDQIGGE